MPNTFKNLPNAVCSLYGIKALRIKLILTSNNFVFVTKYIMLNTNVIANNKGDVNMLLVF